jgi:hypothetical protein
MLGIRVSPPIFSPSSSSSSSSSSFLQSPPHGRTSIENISNSHENNHNIDNNIINSINNNNNDIHNDDEGRLRMVSYPFPMSVVASVGRALDSGFGWMVSRSNGVELRESTSARTENIINNGEINENRTSSTSTRETPVINRNYGSEERDKRWALNILKYIYIHMYFSICVYFSFYIHINIFT